MCSHHLRLENSNVKEAPYSELSTHNVCTRVVCRYKILEYQIKTMSFFCCCCWVRLSFRVVDLIWFAVYVGCILIFGNLSYRSLSNSIIIPKITEHIYIHGSGVVLNEEWKKIASFWFFFSFGFGKWWNVQDVHDTLERIE